MKYISLFLLACMLSLSVHAQQIIQLRNLWAEPQVHVLFNGYRISFTVRDINKTLQLLAETGDSAYGVKSSLDSSKQYYSELFAGYRTEYHNTLQPLMQKGVGAFLLYKGMATIENTRKKKIKKVTMDMQPLIGGVKVADLKFYDPDKGTMIFNGQMPDIMKNADLGLDY
jgi:hypothetical protein